jgi:hypothetical protein
MAYELYCHLIDNVLLSDTCQVEPYQLDFILQKVDSKYGSEIAHKVKILHQARLVKEHPKDHVEIYSAVCTELLSKFTLAKLFMALYFTNKYLDLVQELEQPSKDEVAALRVKLSDELKFLIKGLILECPQVNPLGARIRSWVPWFMGACGAVVGLLGIITYQPLRSMF